MSNDDRHTVVFLQVATYQSIESLKPLEKMVAKKIADETFKLLFSLIYRIEQLEAKKP